METFGRYVLERRIAEGGMGEIFLAHQSGIAGFEKKLVVKRIKPELMHDPKFVEMFLNEGRVAALIDHPNVVHIHELGETDGVYFIAMEYVPGLSLGTVMERLGHAMELPQALYVMINIGEGLAYAHSAVDHDGTPLHLVHRDVSPPNILIGYSGSVKISDFGIAKVEHHRHTAAGVLKGKFAYLSPEQARGEAVDQRSDIYTLGLILFEITVGRRANPGPSDSAMVFCAAGGELPDPGELSPGYPEALRTVFYKATALDPAQRYQQVKEMQEDILSFQLDHRLIVSAGTVGEWLRSLGGAEPDEIVEGVTTSDARPEPAAPKFAYAPTVHATPERETKRRRSLTDELPSFDAAPAVSALPSGKPTPTTSATVMLPDRARRSSHPESLELDLEKERELDFGLGDLVVGRSRGKLALRLFVVALLLAVAAAGYLFLVSRGKTGRGSAPASDGGVRPAPSAPTSGPAVDDARTRAKTSGRSPSAPAKSTARSPLELPRSPSSLDSRALNTGPMAPPLPVVDAGVAPPADARAADR